MNLRCTGCAMKFRGQSWRGASRFVLCEPGSNARCVKARAIFSVPQHEHAGVERDSDLIASWSGALHGSNNNDTTGTTFAVAAGA